MNNQPGASAGLPVGTSQSMDEAQLNQAMKRLKLLYIKARLLRDTIPKMLDPLVQKQPSPDTMFNAFVKAVSDAQMDVKEFTELMRDETTKQVFAQAEKSRQDNPLGIKQWRHKDHPDWFKMDKD
ncbi:hypothetical protein J3458_001034 [Metarhizium acridum]|uniref:uncharacterized protein n=1 Tax=Metarhizium acridum TaxID=92637 RepID=UPI001C6B354B|nr:hypothetical protein J3458_001034 [Metarhizium acridum]